jgi:hypothetical protein
VTIPCSKKPSCVPFSRRFISGSLFVASTSSDLRSAAVEVPRTLASFLSVLDLLRYFGLGREKRSSVYMALVLAWGGEPDGAMGESEDVR